MTRTERETYDGLLRQADICREKALGATHRNSPVAAREWLEAAETAIRAAKMLEGSDRREDRVPGYAATILAEPSLVHYNPTPGVT